MAKGRHKSETVGPWAAQKLDALEAYLRFYNTALKNKTYFKRVYIDAFAGKPKAMIRGSDVPPEPSPFFDDDDALEVRAEYIAGSPLRALSIVDGFHEHYFFDLDESRAETLRGICEDRNDVEIKVGDCNPLVRDLVKRFGNQNMRGVAFLDPYGAHLEWETVEALAATGKFEVIINFPVAMAINRLITKSGAIPENWSDQLNRCFGTEEWRDLSYDVQRNLFGEDDVVKRGGVQQSLLQLYLKRLQGLFHCVAKPRLIRNTRQHPLYFLIWAGPNPLGLKGAEHILGQGEEIKLP
ncbi:three-Cys-motif partner protein TcmP [Pacificispira sp.]|uniref:three-Cys-motif partner protein TcmP n=1 Tax=Pacificispira sp. TaxID=2888761 RepID=UPI003B52BB70